MADPTIKLLTNAALTKTLNVLGATTVQLSDAYELAIPDGTDAGEADQIVPLEYTITASGSQNIDVTALTDIFGDAVAMAEVVAVLIYHDGASAASGVTLSGDLLDTWLGSTASIALGAGDHLSVSKAAAGITVSGTADVITVTNNDGSNAAKVKAIIFGRSA